MKLMHITHMTLTAVTLLLVGYLAYSLFSVQQAFAEFGSGLSETTSQFDEDMKKVNECLEKAGDNLEAQTKCY